MNISPTVCEECGNSLLYRGGEIVCATCGLIQGSLTELLDHHFDSVNLEKQIRYIDALGSFLDYHGSRCIRDKSGALLSPRLQSRFSHLKRVYNDQERYGSYGAHARALLSLKRVSDHLSLCDHVKDCAMYLYKKLLRKNFKKEGSISTLAMAAFCLLHANRLNGNRLLTSKEVIDAFRRMGHRLAPFDLIKAGLLYRKLLNEKPKILRSEDALVMILERIFSNEEVNFILKSCGEKHFELKRKLFRSGMKLLREVKSVQRGGRSPILLATTALYAAERKLAIEENRRPMLTQRLLAKAMHVSEYSVREHFRLFFRPLLRS